MRGAEAPLERREVERAELDAVELDRDLVALPGVAHVEDEADVLVGDVDVLLVEPLARSSRERLEGLADGVRCRRGEARHERLAELVLDLGGDEAERREDARTPPGRSPGSSRGSGERVGVQAAGAAERHERELARDRPRCTVTTRSAPSIASSTMLTIARAVSSTPAPRASATRATAAVGRVDVQLELAAEERGGRWPRTTLASVTVAAVPPRP